MSHMMHSHHHDGHGDGGPTSPSQHQAQLRIQVIEARNLMAKDRNGFSDPYVVLSLAGVSHKTPVVNKNLNPKWSNAEYEFTITPVLLDSSIHLSVWDKDLIGRDFLGQLTLPIHDLLTSPTPLFGDEKNTPVWYPLNPRTPKEPVQGQICLKIGFLGHIDQEIDRLVQVMSEKMSMHAQLISTDDPADDVYFNHTIAGNETETKSMKGSEVTDETSYSPEGSTIDHTSMMGLLSIDIHKTSKLPGNPSKGYDCDPFVVISFGKKTFRTRVLRRALEPCWKERVFLHVRKNEFDSNWIASFSVYDNDVLSKNDMIGKAQIKIQDLVAKSNQTSKDIVRVPNEPTDFKPAQVSLDLEMAKPGEAASLILFATFVPYKDLRRNFWISLAKNYDNDRNGLMTRFELTTMLDSIGSTWSDETIKAIWEKSGKSSDDELPFETIADALEERLTKLEATASSTNSKPMDEEHVIQMRNCPMCHKVIKMKGDLDVVSHVALCAMEDLGKVDSFVMGGFITEAYASRKWYSKILSYVSYGGYNIGKNNANILVQDRATGQLVEEKMPTYIRLGIRMLYHMAGSRTAVESKTIKNLFKNMTLKQGVKFNSPESVHEIQHFIEFHNLPLDEILLPLDDFSNFNEFFYRKLKPSARKLASPDPKIAVSPADARLNVFATITEATKLWIKGTKFSVANLLNDATMAKSFEGGSLVIARLAPQDYHRFHIPVDGVITRIDPLIEGSFYTVNPMAVRTTVDVYTENVRRVTYIQSPLFGLVAVVTIGAMMVGSIVITNSVDANVKRMDELGYFAFGGSTVVLLFQAKKITFDKDLVDNSAQNLETLVKVGNSIGFAAA